MRHPRILLSLLMTLGGGLSTFTSIANAQYFPGGYNPYAAAMNRYSQMTSPGMGIYNPNLYSPFRFNSSFSNSYSYVNPVTGIPYSFNYSFQYSGYAPYIPGVTNRYNYTNYNAAPYYNYNQSSYDSSGNNPIVEQRLRVMRQAGRMPAPMNKAMAGMDPQPMQPPVAGNPAENGDEVDMAQLEAELVNPTEEALLSGDALNNLAKAIQPLQAEKPKVNGSFVTAGVLEDIHFQGSDAAGVLTLFSRTGTELSKPFQKQENIALRVALKEPLSEFKKAYATGKPIPAATVDALSKGITSAETALDQSESSDADQMGDYVNLLSKVLTYSQTADGRGAYNGKWFSIGSSVSDLLSHMDNYKIEFAAGNATARTEYRLLYRAMLDYYAKLKQAR